MSRADVTVATLADSDLAVDRTLADIATSFRFLFDVTPVDLVEARDDVPGHWPITEVRVPAARRRPCRHYGPHRRGTGRRRRGPDRGAPAAGEAA